MLEIKSEVPGTDATVFVGSCEFMSLGAKLLRRNKQLDKLFRRPGAFIARCIFRQDVGTGSSLADWALDRSVH